MAGAGVGTGAGAGDGVLGLDAGFGAGVGAFLGTFVAGGGTLGVGFDFALSVMYKKLLTYWWASLAVWAKSLWIHHSGSLPNRILAMV